MSNCTNSTWTLNEDVSKFCTGQFTTNPGIELISKEWCPDIFGMWSMQFLFILIIGKFFKELNLLEWIIPLKQ